MTSGNIGAWQKKAGDSLQPGDVLVEIETDKAQMDFEFQEEGTLAKILRDAGEKDVAVGNPIAVLVEDGAEVAAFADFTLEDAGGSSPSPSPASSESAKKEETKPEQQQQPQKQEQSTPASTTTATTTEPDYTIDKLEAAIDREGLITPAAKKLALELGVAISSVKGTGPGGRVTREDVEKYKASAPASSGSAAAAPAVFEDLPVSNMRKTIANRLKQSTQQNPHFFVSATLN
ncbi:pyruvate dehydrogenase complex dihydrolipoamide acetyltransferase component (E2), partial [Ascosphaera aggregata]